MDDNQYYLNLVYKIHRRATVAHANSMNRYAAVSELLCYTGLYNIIPIGELLVITAGTNIKSVSEAADYIEVPASVTGITPRKMSADKRTTVISALLSDISGGKYLDYVGTHIRYIYFISGLTDPNTGRSISATSEPLTRTAFVNLCNNKGSQLCDGDAPSIVFDMVMQAGYLDAYHNHPQDYSRGLMSRQIVATLPEKLMSYLDIISPEMVSPCNMQYMDLASLDGQTKKQTIAKLQYCQKSFTDRNAEIRANSFFKELLKRTDSRINKRHHAFLKASIENNHLIIETHNHFMGLPPRDDQIHSEFLDTPSIFWRSGEMCRHFSSALPHLAIFQLWTVQSLWTSQYMQTQV